MGIEVTEVKKNEVVIDGKIEEIGKRPKRIMITTMIIKKTRR